MNLLIYNARERKSVIYSIAMRIVEKSLFQFIIVLSIILFTSCAYMNNKWYSPDPNMPKVYIEKHTEVLKENLDILKSESENTGAILEVAFRYEQLGNYKESVKYYEKVLEIAPNTYVALNNVANIYEEVGELTLAAKRISKLYTLDTSSPEVIQDAIRINLKAGFKQNAQKIITDYATSVRENDASTPEILKFISQQYQIIHSYQ